MTTNKAIDYSSTPSPLDIHNPAGVFIKPLHEYPQSAMSNAQLDLMFNLMSNYGPFCEEAIQKLESEIKNDFSYKVLNARLEAHGIQADFNVRIFLAMSAKSPATLVQFAHSIFHSPLRQPNQSFCMMDLVSMYQIGFPDEAMLSYAWDAQKVKEMGMNDNALDHKVLFEASAAAPYIEPGQIVSLKA
jgi:hypothetical protein